MENSNQPNEPRGLQDVSVLELLIQLWGKVVEFFKTITDIHKGSDQIGTINSIMANKTMTGANVWLLFSAIIVASVGLDANSPAVIIGAMLISPLMSPILGIGLSVAINNRNTLRISLKHFGIAIAVSLVTSFLYFLITPLSSEATSEMLARTSPTILDVLVAFFGGIAGVVSGTRLEKSNAIPGVAIATALLPPLCVAGYGLAHGEWWIFINAFYLFFINSVFVALATYLIVRLLDFPFKQYVNEQEKKRSQYLMIGFVILVIVPSAFIFSSVLEDMRQKRFVKDYTDKNFQTTVNNIDKVDGTDSLELTVFWFGKPMNTTDSISHVNALSKNRVTFRIVQSEYGQEYANHLRRSLKSEELLDALRNEKKSKERLIEEKNELEVKLEDFKNEKHLLSTVSKDYKKTFPELERLAYGKIEQTTDSSCIHLPVLFFEWKKNTPNSKKLDYQKRIATLFQESHQLDTIVVKTW